MKIISRNLLDIDSYRFFFGAEIEAKDDGLFIDLSFDAPLILNLSSDELKFNSFINFEDLDLLKLFYFSNKINSTYGSVKSTIFPGQIRISYTFILGNEIDIDMLNLIRYEFHREVLLAYEDFKVTFFGQAIYE